ncbi:MAG: hypothetical protein KDC87_10960 [Planctomycetes bacterium]|nr:hypothetical protein [Planctomycetota bacterium]
MKRPGGFTVEPNPVQPGNSVTVTGTPGAKLQVITPQGGRQEITLDKDGKATVEEPVGPGGRFSISDFDPKNPHTVTITVVEPVR